MFLSEEKIQFGDVDYSIKVYEDFSGLSSEILSTKSLKNISHIIIITEKKIARLYGDLLTLELYKTGISFSMIYMKGKEKNKHIKRLKKIYNKMIRAKADRKSVVLALGGGVVGDLAGFVAGTYQRGIRFVQVPTTLLACVDSSVGGKVAVNVDKGKNMVGVFHQPCMVYTPLQTLSTLPTQQWKCGLAEVIKHALLTGGTLYHSVKHFSIEKLSYNSDSIIEFILGSVQYKASIVSQDEKEMGMRAVLNLGHTVGHAIESYTEYRKYSHGEAVSIGLVTAMILSMKKTGFPESAFLEVLQIIKNYRLPYKDKHIPISKIIDHIKHDKKASGNTIRFVLLKDIGSVEYGVVISDEEIEHALKDQNEL